jgi:sterol 3beta-glucosyltransferase
VVVTGAGAIELEGDDDVLVLEQAPHGWLLPRVTAAVHHGGVGTLAAALAAGVPQIIRPFMGDQAFWARRAEEMGVAVPARRLTAESFAAALGTAAGLTARAQTLARALDEEDGVRAAVRRIERTIAH